MSRAQRPSLTPTRLDIDYVHDDNDTNDDNAISKWYLLLFDDYI